MIHLAWASLNSIVYYRPSYGVIIITWDAIQEEVSRLIACLHQSKGHEANHLELWHLQYLLKSTLMRIHRWINDVITYYVRISV